MVGVLCIQGAFIEHIKILERLRNQHGYHHIRVVDVREPSQLSHLDGLIIPGGESTTLSVFLGKNGFEGSLREWLFGDPPGGVLWGTCAGLIMVANKLTEQKKGGQITVEHDIVIYNHDLCTLACGTSPYEKRTTSLEWTVQNYHFP